MPPKRQSTSKREAAEEEEFIQQQMWATVRRVESFTRFLDHSIPVAPGYRAVRRLLEPILASWYELHDENHLDHAHLKEFLNGFDWLKAVVTLLKPAGGDEPAYVFALDVLEPIVECCERNVVKTTQ